MLRWKKVCCAVDFADPSRAAMVQAADVAKRFEAELTLLHAIAPPAQAADDVLVSSRGVAAVEAERAQETLARWRADAERRAAQPVRTIVLWGDPVASIVRHVREERCDLLVVGTHGRSGVARLTLGSAAERIARQSPCPVLVVHDGGVVEQEALTEELAQYR
jgi:nucleotide-binding universal stress UspA family protein